MNLSDDIDKTLTDKAKKNQLTKKNVKNLIKVSKLWLHKI